MKGGWDKKMSRAQEIHQALQIMFNPVQLQVADESAKHRGHAGAPDEGESHFHVIIRASTFSGLSRIARHRAIHAALGIELMAQIHALSLDVDAP